MTKLFRLKAIVPLLLVTAMVMIAWSLVIDRVVERSVERIGALIVGAQVDVAEADLRLREGTVVLRGLEVTNPDRPMTNLFVASEVVADLSLRPLLEKKIVIDTMAVRGVRFGTARASSGALENPGDGSQASRGIVREWVDKVRIPPLTFEGLRSTVNVDALSPDSLQSLRLARATVDGAQRNRGEWEAALARLEPRPRIDSARALVAQLRNFNPLRLGPAGVTSLVNNARTSLTGLQSLRSDLGSLDSTSRAGISALHGSVAALSGARDADLAYARGLMRLPSLDAPNLSTSVFGDAVVQWIRPVMYWGQVAERFIPPGLNPRRRAGPTRTRRPGTNVSFPGRSIYPKFLIRHGEVDLELGGEGAAAGAYSALIQGLTTQPAVHGQPTRVTVSKSGGQVGPTGVSALAILDHVRAPTSDSLVLSAEGIALPTFELAPLGARLALGEGTTRLSFRRTGDQIAARIGWTAPRVEWETSRPIQAADAAAPIGTRAWADALLWRTVSSLDRVQLDVEIGGTMSAPTISMRSNVGSAIAQALMRELGQEMQRAEARLRAEVDGLVSRQIRNAEEAVRSLAADMSQRVGVPLEQLGTVEAELREELRKLGRLPD